MDFLLAYSNHSSLLIGLPPTQKAEHRRYSPQGFIYKNTAAFMTNVIFSSFPA
jgi:hypothetical protein